MVGTTSKKRVGVIVGLNLAIALLVYTVHFTTEFEKAEQFDIVLQRLFILPIIMACLWFGWKAGFVATLAASVLMVPNIMFHWGAFSGGDMNRMAQLAVFFILSVVLGKVVELQKKEQTKAREAERLAAIGKSLSAVAHDMKTPLVAIGGMSRIVQRHLPEGSLDREKLEIVIRETQRLENLLKDMLNFSKPLDLSCERVEIRSFLKECLDLIGPIAADHKVRLETIVSGGVSSGYFDPPRVKQALINLAVNAIQASPEGEKVSILCYFRKTDLIFEVSDCGCGIPPKERESVFEPFFSTKKEGTGLGLPIVKKIIEAHAGWIELVEGEEVCTIFRIILPCDESRGCCAAGTLAVAGGSAMPDSLSSVK
jgi:signal transduction histidine kinase